MISMGVLERLFVACAFLFQVVLIIHFAMRKWRYDLALHYGWIVYALSIPASMISLLFWLNSKPWPMWQMGSLFALGAIWIWI